MRTSVPRLMISGTASGSGKTTVACGLMRLLARKGLRVRACKVGPDYLDPTFHTKVLGIPSRNLDLFLGDTDLVRELLAKGAEHADVTVIEGVMGYYDGIGASEEASSFDVARATGTPVVLVVDARGRSLSVAAEVVGFVRFREPSLVAGIILNQVSPVLYPQLKEAVSREAGIPVIGYVPRLPKAELPSRHLGLVRAEEVDGLLALVDAVAAALERTTDVEALLEIAHGADDLEAVVVPAAEQTSGGPLIAVAYDEAFSFYYQESLDLLVRLGARLEYVSPLHDVSLPSGTCGLYLGGGYPELHARELSQNAAFRHCVRERIASGMPVIAECGGFLYLHETIEDADGISWPMVDALGGHAARGMSLGRFGYVTLTAQCDNLLARRGEELRAHEFHYWQSDLAADAFHAQKPQSDRGWDGVIASDTMYAGFPHLYLCGSPHAAERFVRACAAFGATQGGSGT